MHYLCQSAYSFHQYFTIIIVLQRHGSVMVIPSHLPFFPDGEICSSEISAHTLIQFYFRKMSACLHHARLQVLH